MEREEHVYYSLSQDGIVPVKNNEEIPGIKRAELSPKQLDILARCLGVLGDVTFLFDMECANSGELVTRHEWIRRRVIGYNSRDVRRKYQTI